MHQGGKCCGPYAPPSYRTCRQGVPPMEADPYHVPGGPRNVGPQERLTYPLPEMPPLPAIWGARLPAYQTYRPWAVNPNGIIGQTHNMTLADVMAAYNFEELALAEYPIWNEDRRAWLNARITDHFYMREIRGETAAQFIWFVRRHMNEAMPTINPVFAALENVTPEDLIRNIDYGFTSNQVGNATGNATSSADSTTTSSSTSIASTNPLQSKVLHAESDYYDTGSKSDSTSDTRSTSASDSKSDTTNDTTQRTRGYNGRTLAQSTSEWIRSVNNALLLVLAELEPCFSQLWYDHSNMLY